MPNLLPWPSFPFIPGIVWYVRMLLDYATIKEAIVITRDNYRDMYEVDGEKNKNKKNEIIFFKKNSVLMVLMSYQK